MDISLCGLWGAFKMNIFSAVSIFGEKSKMPEKGLQWEATKFILRISYVMNIPIIVFPCLSLTEFCCWYLNDVNLAFEAGNSKLLDVVSVADVDAEECIDASLVENLNLNFGQGFEAEAWSRF